LAKEGNLVAIISISQISDAVNRKQNIFANCQKVYRKFVESDKKPAPHEAVLA